MAGTGDNIAYTLHLPNGGHISIRHCGYREVSPVRNGDADGLIIEGSWGFNDLGGYYWREIVDLLGVEKNLIRKLCDDNTYRNEQITVIALPSTVPESSLMAVAFVPTELGRAYTALTAPFFQKPYRDFYYSVIYEALGLLTGFGCTAIAIAGLRGAPTGHKDINNCVAEAIAHFAIEHQTLRCVLTMGSGPDLSNGMRFFNDHPQNIGRHREIRSRTWAEDQVTKLTIDLP